MSKVVINVILFVWYRYIGALFRLLPIKKNKIVFQNFFGKPYEGDPAILADQLHERYGELCELVWMSRKENCQGVPSGIKVVKRRTFGELYHLATARIWIDNSRKHWGCKKRRQQYYIQTWHGTLGIKKIEKEANMDFWYQKCAKHDSKMINLLLSGSRWGTEQLRRTFWYDGEILECGSMRNRLLRGIDKKQAYDDIRAYFGLKEQCKIVLYVPTFRDDHGTEAYNINYDLLIETLEREWGGEWVVLVRMHPNIADKIHFNYTSKKIINASEYLFVERLIAGSELVISDYSNCIFDAMYLHINALLYASDIQEYSKTRGFSVDLKALPAKLAQNNSELLNQIKSFNREQYLLECDRYFGQVGLIDNDNPWDVVIDKIMSVISGED